MNNWHDRFEAYKKGFKNEDGSVTTNKDIAETCDLSEGNIKNLTKPSRDFPKQLRQAIVTFERLSKKKEGKQKDRR